LKEVEGFGVTYERYAIGKLLGEIAAKYGIKKILEIPAGGAKAMPSIYSIGFGLAGCDVYLVNPSERARGVWDGLGLANNVHFVECRDVENTGLESDSFDLVWNCIAFPTYGNPNSLLKEMIRISKKYVMTISVNAYNVGFPWHRFLHRVKHIPWTHGDITYNFLGKVGSFFKRYGLKIVKVGVVDTPPWPDSLGFRDIRLHRMNIDINKTDWHSTIVDYIKQENYPVWLKAIWMFEKLPVPMYLKLPYSHLFYVLGEK